MNSIYFKNTGDAAHMTHEEISMNTKHALAESLKKMLTVKPFSKITISDIIKDCNVNRKTFYYHFEDIYALLRWMLDEEAVQIVKHFDLLTEYKDAILFVADYIEQNQHILNCVYDSMGHDEMKRFLYNDFINITTEIIEESEDLLQLYLDDSFKHFLAEFYTGALASIIIEWLKNPGTYDREELADNIFLVFRESLPGILQIKGENPKNQ